jgi:hypothetical protein
MDFVVAFGFLKSFKIEYNQILLSILWAFLRKHAYSS